MPSMGFSSSSSSSSTVRVGGAGTATETKVRAVVPVPHRITAEQIDAIKEAFRRAGIEFDCIETDGGAYSFSFTVRTREA